MTNLFADRQHPPPSPRFCMVSWVTDSGLTAPL